MKIHWAQRAKERWLALGNKNTKYFHKVASKKMRKNRIVCLKGDDGELVHDSDTIKQLFLKHFKSLFECGNLDREMADGGADSDGGGEIPHCFQPLSTLGVLLTEEQRRDLDASFAKTKV